MNNIAARLASVSARLVQAQARFGRTPDAVQLIAVSKTQPASAVRAAFAAGQTRFGESYVQEALAKMAELHDCALEWHFIGPIQSNKTKDIATHFAWVHSVDRAKIAQRLNEQRPDVLPPLNVCLQVNVSGEATKFGTCATELEVLATAVRALPRLCLRGLMAIPAPEEDFRRQRAVFHSLRALFENLNGKGFALDTLSMGMSDDLEAAIAEGATLVRVGSALFGERGGSGEEELLA